ncbi:hypothetical protein FHS51_000774 [Sphingobium wenxiniae]|uniref:Uncharacterized protein n=1 Tax=Sphingobium wenxiniae (strain DSM 21828 / CGMCC 1.7748 / JZ-1) TaxID=595605 RepID=A0A562KJ03_SPHWJ|nr:hypothetical protein [Sphingobium wenxiniae]MBB6190561.1 hypothetical protein [Sphingobium wenxiniae]TWH95275.1 hypothetical protein IQ35_01531 [Sphingobium wenxiniae]
MTLTYSELIKLLAAMNGIADESEGAFKARLRHFQRLGFPRGSNTGKGRRAEYDLDMVMQLALAIEFMQAGVSPQRTVDLISKNWLETRIYMLFAAAPGELKSDDGRVLSNELALCVSPESLRDLSTDGESEIDYYEAFEFVEVSKLPAFFGQDAINPTIGVFYRWIVILLRPLVAILFLRMEEHLNIDAEKAFSELQSNVEKQAKLIEEGARAINETLAKRNDQHPQT